MKQNSPETFRPMISLGTEVDLNGPEQEYDQPLSLEEEASFKRNLTAITEAERLGALEGYTIILG